MAQDAPLHRELSRAARAGGDAAAHARRALGDAPAAERLRAAVLALTLSRGAASSICPSDAARAVGGTHWRALLDQARAVAADLAAAGQVVITQGGDAIDPAGPWRGPIRITSPHAHPPR